ncbi:hypothetical protein QBC44DRAFT_363959 [Cladorrhinum sp. PSN332]|nr:hypothetical protein QBC44DRAFT_363959 [Cladorrhinum sp. PSN332]
MAEVVGTAVGVAAFGARICQGMATYLRSIKARHRTISDGLKEIENLTVTLSAFSNFLPNLDDGQAGSLDFLRNTLKDCDEHLLSLEQLLVKLSGSSNPDSIKEKLKRAGRAMVHPFRQEELTSLQQHVQRLLNNLNLIMNIISLKHLTDVETVRSAHREQNMNHLSSLEQTLTSKTIKMEQELSQTQLTIQELDDNVNGKLTVIHDEIRSMGSASFLMYQRATELLEQMAGENKTGLVLNVSRPPQDHCRKSDLNTTSLRKLATCNCKGSKRRPGKYSYRLWGVTIYLEQEKPPSHQRTCRFHALASTLKPRRRVRAEFPLRFGWLLGRINWLSIHYVMGVNNLSASLELQNIVPSKQCRVTQQLVILNDRVWRGAPESCEAVIKSTEASIIELYRSGKASPDDRDEDGWGHGIKCMQVLMGMICYIRISPSIAEKALQLYRTLTDTIKADDEAIEQFSASIIINIFFRTMLRNQLKVWRENSDSDDEEIAVRRIICNFISSFNPNLAAVYEPSDNGGFGRLLDMPALEHVDESPLLTAICRQSMKCLEDAITTDPNSTTRIIRGHTMLQISATWSEGLQRLLSTDAIRDLDVGQHDSQSPLALTCRFKYPEALDVVMKAGCRIPVRFSAKKATSLDLTVLDVTSDECVTIFAKNLADRRWKLLSMAQDSLGVYRNWNPTHVPDDIASDICNLLAAAKVSIPEYLTIPPGYKSIYHNPSLSMRHFPIFLAHGFRVHGSHNFMGLTASTVWRGELLHSISWHELTSLPSTVSWLEQHGFFNSKPTDPLQLGLNTHATGWHYWAATLGHELAQGSMSEGKTPPGRDLIKKISQVSESADTHDKCDNQGTSNFALDLVRFLTFEALDMIHTCCFLHRAKPEEGRLYIAGEMEEDDTSTGYNHDPMVLVNCPEDLVGEIRGRQIEEDGAELLKGLMAEFEEEMKKMDNTNKSPKALETFLLNYWRDRMLSLLTVDETVVGEMKRVVGKVTCELPKRVEAFLGGDFWAFSYGDDHGSEQEYLHTWRSEKGRDKAHLLERYCRICDDRNMKGMGEGPG